MTEYTGSILELNKNKAIVMTNACDFVSIQRQSGMFVGQQVKFKKSDIVITHKNYMKYLALVASVFVLALCSVFYFQIFQPSTVFAYIDVDINPSVEFVIDKNAKVIDLKPLNKDAQILLKDLKLVDLPVKEAISELVITSKRLGFISAIKDNAVLISASIDTDISDTENISKQKVLDNILSDIGSATFDTGTQKIQPDVLKVTSENRKFAIKNNISMGRYTLYSKIKEENKEITVEKAKTERVSDMLIKAKIKGYDKNKANDSKDKASSSKDSNSDDKISKASKTNTTNGRNSSNKDSTDDEGTATKNGKSTINPSVTTKEQVTKGNSSAITPDSKKDHEKNAEDKNIKNSNTNINNAKYTDKEKNNSNSNDNKVHTNNKSDNKWNAETDDAPEKSSDKKAKD